VVIAELNLNLCDLQRFYDQRGDHYKNEYATCGIEPDCTTNQLDRALAAKMLSTRNWDNTETAQRHSTELEWCHALLI